MFIRRGDIWWINFDPSVGQEIRKNRPAVVVSNDNANKFLSRFVVIPLTSSIKRIYPSECLVQTSEKTSKAMASQLRTVSMLRFVSKLGTVNDKDMQAIEEAIRMHLAL